MRNIGGKLAPQSLAVLLFRLIEHEDYRTGYSRIGLDGAAKHAVKAPVGISLGFAPCTAECAGKQLSQRLILRQREHAPIAALGIRAEYLESAVVMRQYISAMIYYQDALLHMRYRFVKLGLFQPELAQPCRHSAALVFHLCDKR